MELKCHIVEYVQHLTDLKRLSLTNKSLRTAVVPKLYHDLVIDLDSCTLPELDDASHPLHLGLKHVKSLHFRPSKPKDAEGAFRTMRLFVLQVPENALREIWLPSGLAPDTDFASSLFRNSLFRRQQQLSALQLGMIPSTVGRDFETAALSSRWADSITTLHVPGRHGNLQEVNGYATIIKLACRLRDLRIGFYTGCTYRLVERSSFPQLFQEVARCGRVLRLDRVRLVELSLDYTRT